MELVYLLFKELMKRGWKVYGEYDELMSYGQTRGKKDFGFGVLGETKYSLRELVSKESGLWQFCCRNKLVDGKPEWIKVCDGVVREEKDPDNSHYRIIECALKDENELEQFLIENIKI